MPSTLQHVKPSLACLLEQLKRLMVPDQDVAAVA
jgi:hypothetical protein